MRLHIEGHNTQIAAYVLGWIAERLGNLNTAHDDIVSAQVVLKQQQRQTEACIELRLVGKTLSMRQCGKTQGEAVHATLQVIEQHLGEFRRQQRLPQRRFARS